MFHAGLDMFFFFFYVACFHNILDAKTVAIAVFFI